MTEAEKSQWEEWLDQQQAKARPAAGEDSSEWVPRFIAWLLVRYGIPLFAATIFVFLCWKGIAWAWAALFG